MELGGHAPLVIFPDVDPEQAAKVTAVGKFRNNGQVCISPTRIYVHEAIRKPFRQEGLVTGPRDGPIEWLDNPLARVILDVSALRKRNPAARRATPRMNECGRMGPSGRASSRNETTRNAGAVSHHRAIPPRDRPRSPNHRRCGVARRRCG